ncbi:MAG: hypothetical protein MI824_22985 [Hyphomicrobiales bacterium]|nr:hypothetical protein [Hyphomicrobiales bacterium]
MAERSDKRWDILTVFVLLVLGILIAFFFLYVATRGVGGSVWSYKDFVTISLTVVTVVLAALGLGIALLAIWGYAQIEKLAGQKAEEVAKKAAEDHLSSEEFRERFRETIEKLQEERAIRSVTGEESPKAGEGDAERAEPTPPPERKPPDG